MIYITPKKLHAKKEKKLPQRFWDWPLHPAILGQLYAKIDNKLLNSFGENGLPSAKFDLSYLEKWPLEWFNQIFLLICDLYHAKENNLLKRFWDWHLPPPPPTRLDLWSDSTKSFFWYVIYIMPKKLHAKKNVTEAFLRLPPPPPPHPHPQSWRTDRQTDHGQLGITKALLPFGSAGRLQRQLEPLEYPTLPLLGLRTWKSAGMSRLKEPSGEVKYPGQVAPTTRSLILVHPRPKEEVFKVFEPKLWKGYCDHNILTRQLGRPRSPTRFRS